MTSQPINNGALAFQLNSFGLSMMGNCQVLWPVNNGYNPLNDVASFTFHHRRSKLKTYGSQTLSLFAAPSPNNHACVITLDKGIKVQVGEWYNLLLTDHAQFNNLRLYWLNLISAGSCKANGKGKVKLKSDFRCEDPCDKWNHGVCCSKASECKYRHICQECWGDNQDDVLSVTAQYSLTTVPVSCVLTEESSNKALMETICTNPHLFETDCNIKIDQLM